MGDLKKKKTERAEKFNKGIEKNTGKNLEMKVN